MKHKLIKVAITGPESVGKSTLAQQLAEHFNGRFVSEYARDYVENLNRKYTFDDVEIIAREQCKQYKELDSFSNIPYVFFDTFLIITKIWFDYVWNKHPNWLDEAIKENKMDLYLLCYPDLKWMPDGARENESIRMELFELYRKELEAYNFKYQIVKGEGEQRVKNAINIINNLNR